MPLDVAHLLVLDEGCVQEHAEFQHFIRSRDAAGTKTGHANGHHNNNATAAHDFILPVLIRVARLVEKPAVSRRDNTRNQRNPVSGVASIHDGTHRKTRGGAEGGRWPRFASWGARKA